MKLNRVERVSNWSTDKFMLVRGEGGALLSVSPWCIVYRDIERLTIDDVVRHEGVTYEQVLKVIDSINGEESDGIQYDGGALADLVKAVKVKKRLVCEVGHIDGRYVMVSEKREQGEVIGMVEDGQSSGTDFLLDGYFIKRLSPAGAVRINRTKSGVNVLYKHTLKGVEYNVIVISLDNGVVDELKGYLEVEGVI